MNILEKNLNEELCCDDVRSIAAKVISGIRISVDEAVVLYQKADLGILSQLATFVCSQKNRDNVYYNRNFHIEPTNICRYNCRFCSYHKEKGDPQSWVMSEADIRRLAMRYVGTDITEAHIVGGVHPKWGLKKYCSIIKTVRGVLPHVHIKAFSAIELEYVFSDGGYMYSDGFKLLKEAGLNSIPGGGAEIFDDAVRQKICPEKADAQKWLAVHRTAHEQGLTSNATMLYGHIESYRHRAEHMDAIRTLQDQTHGFSCFIPLKYRSANNSLSYLGEVPLIEDLRNYAVCRIFMDNVQHMKAYWPMLGVANTKLALSFGADDIDGTIDDTTKIYSMAGAEEQKPRMTVDMLKRTICGAGKVPVERNSLYQPVEH